MKKIFLFSTLIGIIILTTSAIQSNVNQCDFRKLKSELFPSLKPDYKYCSSKVTKFKFTKKQQTIKTEAPLLASQKFKFLFNTSGLPEDIEIKIYDKKGSSGKELFSLKKVQKKGESIYSFEPKSSSKVYINYILPSTKDDNINGCLIMVLGYKTKTSK